MFARPFKLPPVVLNGYAITISIGEVSKGSLVLTEVANSISAVNLAATSELVADSSGIAGNGVNLSAVDELVLNTKYAIELSNKVVLQAVEPLVASIRVTTGLESHSGIDIFDEDTLVRKNTTCLNFKGTEVQTVEGAPCVDVYVPSTVLDITSFSATPAVVEKGRIVGFVTLTWAYLPDEIETQVLTGPAIINQPELEDRTKVTDFFLGATEDRTWQLDATDSFGNADTEFATLQFGALFYSGKRPEATIGQNEIEALSDISLEVGKLSPLTYISSVSPEYLYVSYPAAWGVYTTFIDSVTGFPFPMQRQLPDVLVTNNSGYSTDYIVFRSVNKTAGQFTLTAEPVGADGPLPPGLTIPSDGLNTDLGSDDFLVVSNVDYLGTGDP